MDPLSLAASIAGLASLVGTVVSTTYGYGSSVIGQSESKRNFLSELQNLRTTLQQLEGFVAQSNASTAEYPQVSARLSSAVNECKGCIEELLQKLQDKQERGKIKSAIRHLTWPFTEKDILKTVAMLDRFRGTFQLALSVDAWNLSSLTLSEVMNIRETQDKSNAALQREQVLQWLSPLEPRTKHEDVIQRRAPNTGQWLLQSPVFQQFIAEDPSTKGLWCHGLPGAGKTVISSLVIDNLQDLAEQPRSAVIYYYFDYQKSGAQHPDIICASLLRQLAQNIETMPTQMEELYAKLKHTGTRPTSSQLTPIILSVLSHFATTYVVIDAFDECLEDYRVDFLTTLTQLQVPSVHTIITSRPHIDDIKTTFPQWPHFEIQAHHGDTRRLFDQKLERNPKSKRRITTDLKEEIVHAIVEKAEGMFLWAALQIDQVLKPKTVSTIRKVLQEMPTSIFEVFDQNLLRVKKEDDGSALALRLFLWLAFAKIPLPFAALAHALSIDPDAESIDCIDQENIPAIEDLGDTCCGFVMLDEDRNLRFVHFTVQEYFESHREKLQPYNESTIAKICLSYLSLKEFEIAECETNQDVFQRLAEYPLLYYAAHWWADHVTLNSQHEIESKILGIYLNKARFRSYSQVFYWNPRGELWQSRLTVGESWQPLLVGGNPTWSAPDSKGYTPLHNAALCRVPSVVQHLLSEGENPCAQTPEGYTPLHAAVEANDKDTVEFLLAASAKFSEAAFITQDSQTPKGEKWVAWTAIQEAPASRNFSLGLHCKADPVTLAAILGYGDLLEIFLSNETGMDMVGEALDEAVRFCQEQIVARILKRSPIDHSHPAFTRAISKAASNTESRAIFHAFMTLRPNLDDKNDILTAILPSVCRYYPEYVAELLNKGAKVNGPPLKEEYNEDEAHPEYMFEGFNKYLKVNGPPLKDKCNKNEGSPLEIAIATRNETLARFLISQGADVSVKVRAQEEVRSSITTLQLAVKNGLESITKLLLDLGADIDCDDRWETPLTIAALYGHEKLVEMLLERNANVEGSNKSRMTPLIACARDTGEHVGVAKTLIENGADINADTGCGTPLQNAVFWGNESLARLLLDNGVTVNHRGVDAYSLWSQTPLGIAVAEEQPGMSHLLLSRGADPNFVERPWWPYSGRTTLMSACDCDGTEIVTTLLDFGADINSQGTDGSCPLEIAVESRNAPLCQLLLERGAVPTDRILSNAKLSETLQEMRTFSRIATKVSEDEAHEGMLHSA